MQGYKWDLSDEDAQELGRRSICAAGHRDAYSGNTINLYHVRENGWEFIGESCSCLVKSLFQTDHEPDNYDLSELWYKYDEEKKSNAKARKAQKQGTEAEPIAVE